MRFLDPRLATPLARAFALTVLAGIAVYVAYLASGRGTTPGVVSALVNDWLRCGLVLAAAGACLYRAGRLAEERAAWLVLGVGLLLWAIGQIVWSALYAKMETPPYPSVSDVLWLAGYPAYYVALVLLLRSRVRRFQASQWLDGLVGTLALGAVGTQVLFEPISQLTGGSTATIATTLAYPLADLMLLALVVAVFALNGWRPGAAWLLLAIGFALNIAADSIYTFQAGAGTYQEGTLLDALWVGAQLTLAAAAWQRPHPAPVVRLDGARVLVAPAVLAALAVSLVAYDLVHPLNVVAGVLALATLVLVMVRAALTFRENLSLLDTRRQALTDDLTGLANRRQFYVRADEHVGAALATGKPTGLLLIDLDRFKELNDGLGHHAGDQVLVELARRLERALGGSALVARLGGDEFAVLLAPDTDLGAARRAGQRVHEVLEEPFAMDGARAYVQASIGLAVAPDHGHDRETLLRHADVAMYRAKAAGTGQESYEPHGDDPDPDRFRLANELRVALDQGELVLHYQPKSDIATGAVTGAEALVRWQHPTRGLLYPDAFLPLAERGGLMRQLTLHVLDLALGQSLAWKLEGLRLVVAVNLSVVNLLDVRFPDDVAALLDRWKTGPGELQLEITENTIMVNPERAMDVLARLGEMGIGLSLDDYGPGYSSLAYLKRLPVQELKIDRSFVMEMLTASDDAVIVRSTINLARNLGLRVVAEGVENAETWDELAGYGCHIAQGGYLSRPVPADELARWVERRSEGLDGTRRSGSGSVPG